MLGRRRRRRPSISPVSGQYLMLPEWPAKNAIRDISITNINQIPPIPGASSPPTLSVSKVSLGNAIRLPARWQFECTVPWLAADACMRRAWFCHSKLVYTRVFPARAGRWHNAKLKLGQRLRHWPNINTTLGGVSCLLGKSVSSIRFSRVNLKFSVVDPLFYETHIILKRHN